MNTRTGGRVPTQLSERGVPVCAIVRTVPAAARGAVVSCLGHTVRLRRASSDRRRGAGERAYMGVLRALVPPARDDRQAADVLALEVDTDSPVREWVVVRPDTPVVRRCEARLSAD